MGIDIAGSISETVVDPKRPFEPFPGQGTVYEAYRICFRRFLRGNGTPATSYRVGASIGCISSVAKFSDFSGNYRRPCTSKKARDDRKIQ